jgi:hypothetical protein
MIRGERTTRVEVLREPCMTVREDSLAASSAALVQECARCTAGVVRGQNREMAMTSRDGGSNNIAAIGQPTGRNQWLT